jgi:hypothetical protein
MQHYLEAYIQRQNRLALPLWDMGAPGSNALSKRSEEQRGPTIFLRSPAHRLSQLAGTGNDPCREETATRIAEFVTLGDKNGIRKLASVLRFASV